MRSMLQSTFITGVVLVFALDGCASAPVAPTQSHGRLVLTDLSEGPPPPRPQIDPQAPPCQGFKACSNSFTRHHYYMANVISIVVLTAVTFGTMSLLLHFARRGNIPSHPPQGPTTCNGSKCSPAAAPSTCLDWFQLSPALQSIFPKPAGC